MVILHRDAELGSAGGGADRPPQPRLLRSASLVVSGSSLEDSIRFYTQFLGLQLIASLEGDPDQPRAVLASDLSPKSFQLELLAQPLTSPAGSSGMQTPPAGQAGPGSQAAGLGHFSLAVPDAAAAVEALKAGGYGALVVDDCAAVIPVRSHGQSFTDRTARVRDINGATWQLMEVRSGKVLERVCSVMVHVADLRASLEWYTGVLGMAVHQQYESDQTGYLSALLGYGPQLECTLLELRQQQSAAVPPASGATQATAPGTAGGAPAAAHGQARLQRFSVEVVGTLEEEAARVQALGQPFEVGLLPSCRDPAELVRALAVSDADGWRFCLVPANVRQAAQSGGGDAPASMEE